MLDAEVGPGVQLRMKLPEGARELAPTALPAFDVSALPGAVVELQRGFGAPMSAAGSSAEEAILVVVGCLRGPSDKWAPGVEELLFDRATALARRAIGADLERLEVGAIRAEGKVIQQRLHSPGLRRGEPARVEARHLLGFAGDARDGVLCSVGCAEPLAPGQKEGAVCAEIIGSASLEGALMDAPPPSFLVRLILASAERPLHAGLVAAALGLALVALVLARRPRPRPI